MFTETYIEMVSKADEIQGLCKYKKGDWFWNGEKPYLYCKSGLGSSNPHDYKWLPTLEDLFNLLDVRFYIAFGKDLTSTEQRDIKYVCIPYKHKSMKENILPMIMETEYNKSWNPTKREWEERNDQY